MRKVARQHVVEVAFVHSIHAECKVVHEGKCVVLWPNAVQEVKQCVQTNDSVAYIALWQSVNQIGQISVKLLIEVPLRHLRKQTECFLLTQQRWKSK